MPATLTAPRSGLPQKTDPRAGKYISFRLGQEEFAIGVLGVREIVGIQEITAVPQTPHGVKGVINLRGKVIPVVDLRLRFGLAELAYSPRTCIIVVQIDAAQGEGAGASLLAGVIVDAVSEVLNLQGAAVLARDGQNQEPGEDSAGYECGAVGRRAGRVGIVLSVMGMKKTCRRANHGRGVRS
jgi:purine-binding chemotaxis protein CheW